MADAVALLISTQCSFSAWLQKRRVVEGKRMTEHGMKCRVRATISPGTGCCELLAHLIRPCHLQAIKHVGRKGLCVSSCTNQESQQECCTASSLRLPPAPAHPPTALKTRASSHLLKWS